MTSNPRDLGLSYEEAAHGIQTATKYEQDVKDSDSGSPKHLRVGINLRASDHAALVHLLIKQGLFTADEYLEAVRLFANEELARHEDLHPEYTFR